MTDQSVLVGSAPIPSVQPPTVAVPTVGQTTPNPLGFTTPSNQTPVSNVTSSPTATGSPVNNQTISQVLQQRIPHPTVSADPPAVNQAAAIPPTTDKTKLASIDTMALPTTQAVVPSSTNQHIGDPVHAPVNVPFTLQPLSQSFPTSYSTAALSQPQKQSVIAPASSGAESLAGLQHPTVADYIPPTVPNAPITPVPSAPIAPGSSAATTSETAVAPHELPESQKTIYRFIHFFATFVLIFMGILGIYAALRFIMVDFPAFERSFQENLIGEQTIMNFTTKAGTLLLATSISLFFVVHTNVFRKKDSSLGMVIASITTVLLVGGLMFTAMSIQL